MTGCLCRAGTRNARSNSPVRMMTGLCGHGRQRSGASRRVPAAGLLSLAVLVCSSPSASSVPEGAVARSFLPTARVQPGSQTPEVLRPGYELTLPDLVSLSDVIVAGQVLDVRPSWNADRSDIFTTVIARVDRPLKGRAAGEVRFRVPGGTVGDAWVWVTHAPRFEIGERALIFLRSNGGRLPTVVGMEAGKRRLLTDDDGSERILPELLWSDVEPARQVVVTTVDEFAAALSRIEAQGRSPQKD